MLCWSRDDVGSERISEHEGNGSIDLALGGISYRVSEYIPLVVMHASSIHESFISRANSHPDILAGCYTNHLQ